MPVSIQWEESGVLLVFSGKVGLDDYQELAKQLTNSERYDDIRYVVCDYCSTESQSNALYQEENEIIAAFTAGLLKEKNFAVVDVVSDPTFTERSRHYGTLATHPFAFFPSLTDARNWITGYLHGIQPAPENQKPAIDCEQSEFTSMNLRWEDRGVLVEIDGKLTLNDFRKVLKLGREDPRYDSARYLILDSTNQKPGCALRKWEIEVLAFFAKGVFKEKNFIVAEVVNPTHEESAAAAECYDKLAVHPHAVFTNMADARNWIKNQLDNH